MHFVFPENLFSFVMQLLSGSASPQGTQRFVSNLCRTTGAELLGLNQEHSHKATEHQMAPEAYFGCVYLRGPKPDGCMLFTPSPTRFWEGKLSIMSLGAP